MKVIYDSDTDTLSVILTDAPVAESDEDKPGVILDYDQSGNLVLRHLSCSLLPSGFSRHANRHRLLPMGRNIQPHGPGPVLGICE